MPIDRENLVSSGRRRLATGTWTEAGESFRAALDLEETGEALLGLGEALWWLGETREAIAYQERGFAAFLREGHPDRAANAALWLSLVYRQQIGNTAASDGWIARFARLVEEFELEQLQGWLLVIKAFSSDGPEAEETWARQAHQLGRTSGDQDLEFCAASQVGAALIRQGRIAEGVTWLDESMVGAFSGEGAALDTVVWTSCNMIISCTRSAEFERAVQWIRAADAFTRRYGCPYLFSECRTSYGGVLLAMGDWDQAEHELQAAIELSQASAPAHRHRALATLAELRMSQGQVEEAEHLVNSLADSEAATAVWARIHLALGRPTLAAATLRRRLSLIGEERLESAVLLELLGEAEIEQGEHQSAVKRGRWLAELGESTGSRLALAQGHRLWGRALEAVGEVTQARLHLDVALTTFVHLEMPFEAARTRMLCARVLVDQAADAAVAEAQLALESFEALGAGRDADAAAAFLRQLGVKAARTGPRGVGALTKREHQVLSLLAEGRSNPEIADRLYLSRRTVEHHVAHVLAKLGVRTRGQAVAEAARRHGRK